LKASKRYGKLQEVTYTLDKLDVLTACMNYIQNHQSFWNMKNKTHQQWLEYYLGLHPELVDIERQVRQVVKNTKKAVYPYQAAALYHLAVPFNGGKALEIGTAYGYSGFYLANAMSDSQIISLNASEGEVEYVQNNGVFKLFPNVKVLHRISWEYLKENSGTADLNFIFVDGDHKRVKKDFPFFNRLIDGGLMVFHDYSPLGSKRHCPPVYEAVNNLAKHLGRKPDVLIIDDGNVGMAGFYRQPGETI
jgi:predicted O-methyltransferase YrrM